MNKAVRNTVVVIGIVVVILIVVAAWAISLIQKPAAENPNSEAYVYEPKAKTDYPVAENTAGDVSSGEAQSSIPDSETPTVIEPESAIADKHQDMVKTRGNIPITHTEWLNSESDLDEIYAEIESYAAANSMKISEIELLYYDETARQYEIELYPSEAVVKVRIN